MNLRIILFRSTMCLALASICLINGGSRAVLAQAPAEPGPHIIAQQAGFIAVGTVQFSGNQCIFTATERLKGADTVGVQVTLTSPVAGFAVDWLLANVGDAATIIVGTYDIATGQVSLTSGQHSVWPQGTFPDYFADKTIVGCKDFIAKAHLN